MISEKPAFELQQESLRWKGDDYFGVVFVHPDDKEDVVDYIFDNYLCKLNHKRSELTFMGAYSGKLRVVTLEDNHPENRRLPQHDYGGYEITTCIIDTEALGKHKNGDFVPVNEKLKGYNRDNLFMFMMSRMRTRVNSHPRMVVV